MLANKNQDPAGKTAFTGSFDALELAIYKVGFISLSRDLFELIDSGAGRRR